ncbi:hypothetical protein FQN49_006182 [Arthroderma sp. PD_2]|nr:hypothetical protein FQN49_006182 [Arthroderma sp. PD_2]
MDNADMMDRTLAPKGKPSGINMPHTPAVLQPRQGMEKERSQPKLYPLVQAPASQPNLAAPGDELHQRSVSTSQLPPSHRNQQGPRMGYFTDERRDGRPSGSHVAIAAHMQEQDVKPMPHSLSGQVAPGMTLQTLQRQNPNVVPQIQDPGEIPRYAPLSQPPTFPQGSYLQPPGSVRNTAASRSHSRHSSRTIPSAITSPVQRHIKLDTDPTGISAMERPAPMGPSGYLPPGHPASVGRQAPALTPPTDHGRPRIATASAVPEPPRHVPAKRSNIMNILNDEPEEPQPRKRFASDQAAPSGAIRPPSPSRPVYQGRHSTSSQPAHPDDQHHYQRQQQYYSGPSQPQQPQTQQQQQQQAQVQSGSGGQYADIPPTSTRGSTTQDWMARFDPREQQSHSSPASNPAISRLPSYSHGYSGPGPHASHSLSGVQHMSDQPQPAGQQPPQRQPYAHQGLQQPSVQGLQDRGLGPSGRESPNTRHIQTHPHTRSPVQRHNAPYGSKVSQQRSTSPLQSGPGGLNPHVSQIPGYSQPGGNHQKPSQSQHQPGPSHLMSQSHQHGMQGGSGPQYGSHIQQLPGSSSRHPPPQSVIQQEQAHQHHQHQHQHHQHLHQHQHQHQRSHHQPQSHQHHQHQSSLSLSQRSSSPFGHSPHMTPQQASSHAQMPRPSGPMSGSNAATHPSMNMGRSYTPPSNLGQHHPQSGSSSGLTYSNASSHPLHQSSQGNNPHQQHLRPRHGSGGPPPPSGPGHHNIYPQEPRQ